MSLNSRLARLEASVSVDDGYCRCAAYRLVREGEDEPEVCPTCGRPPRVRIWVVYDDARARLEEKLLGPAVDGAGADLRALTDEERAVAPKLLG